MRLLQFAGKYACPLRGCFETVAVSEPAKIVGSLEWKRWKRGKTSGFRKRRQRQEVRTMLDGREILSGAAKRARWMAVYDLDGGRCHRCGRRLDLPYTNSVNSAEIHHVEGRGMSGGKRDDRIFVDGKRNLETLCPGLNRCHAKAGPQLAFGKNKSNEQGEIAP
jgi:hypothetical protein